MRDAKSVIEIHHKRGVEDKPIERLYRHLFNPELYLHAYGKLYRNEGAMTKGVGNETVDGMRVEKIRRIIEKLKAERYTWKPTRRVYIPKANGKPRPLGMPSWSDVSATPGTVL